MPIAVRHLTLPTLLLLSGSLLGQPVPIHVKDLPGYATFLNSIVTDGELNYHVQELDGFRKIWATDGTGPGTRRVTEESTYYDLAIIDDKLFYQADIFDDGTWVDRRLWVKEGSASSHLVKDINPNGFDVYENLVVLGNKVYFTANDGVNGYELWASDGSADGTHMVTDISASEYGGYPHYLKAFNGRVYFSANDGVHGQELWSSDGTPEGTHMVFDLPGQSSNPIFLFQFGDKLYFSGLGPTGLALWQTDGTTTTLFHTTYGDLLPCNMLSAGDSFYFMTHDLGRGVLWKSDGTVVGTHQVMTGPVEPESLSFFSNRAYINGKVYFKGTGDDLWITDGTGPGTSRVAPVYPGSFTVLGDTIYFMGSTPNGYVRMLYTAPHLDGVYEVEMPDGSPATTYYDLGVYNNELYFGAGLALWKLRNVEGPATPSMSAPGNQGVCGLTPTEEIEFQGTGENYEWVNDRPDIGLAASGTGLIPSFVAINITNEPIVANIVVKPVSGGIAGALHFFSITVYPAITFPTQPEVCSGAAVQIQPTWCSAEAQITWSRQAQQGIIEGESSGEFIIDEVLTSDSPFPVIVIYHVNVSVMSQTMEREVYVTVTPAPQVEPISDLEVAHGELVNTIVFSASPGSEVTWTNSLPEIGTSQEGSNFISAFIAVNPGEDPLVAEITVTAQSAGCAMGSMTFNIRVNGAAPTMAYPQNQDLCGLTPTEDIIFEGTAEGYDWVNDRPDIGLAASGNGHIPSFVAINASNETVTANIIVTPVLGGIEGTPRSFSIMVYPAIHIPETIEICSGTALGFGLNSCSGAQVSWSRQTQPGIMEGANSGEGIIDEVLTSESNSPVTVAYHFTVNNMSQTIERDFLVTVTPEARVEPVSDLEVDHDEMVNAIVFEASQGSVVTWTNSLPQIGTGPSGADLIESFTATNPGEEPLQAQITVTAQRDECGMISTMSFNILVNPEIAVVTGDNGQGAKIAVYPNPASDYVTISGIGRLQKAELYTSDGQRQPLELEQDGSSYRAPVGHLASGLYILLLNEGERQTVLKFLKR